MRETRVHTVKAEMLTAAGWAPYGQVIGRDDVAIEARDGEVLHLDVLSYDRKPIRVDHLNRHHKATQALVSLGGKPWVIVVGAPALSFESADDLRDLRAFICDGTLGINLARGTWHEGPFPLMEHVDLVNVQGRHVDDDNQVAHLERDLGVVVEVAL